MADKFSSYRDLERQCDPREFNIRAEKRDGPWAVIAPHGGGIEPGTSEIAAAIAGDDISFYAFEGARPQKNGELHITSACFDEPAALEMAATTDRMIAIHGEAGDSEIIYIGGTDQDAIRAITAALEARGFTVARHDRQELQGQSPDNICNKGQSGKGVQLELSRGLRETFFKALNRKGRLEATPRAVDFADAVRSVLKRHMG